MHPTPTLVPYRRHFSEPERRRSARSRTANTLIRRLLEWEAAVPVGSLTSVEQRAVETMMVIASRLLDQPQGAVERKAGDR
jgi:hypothetical protein